MGNKIVSTKKAKKLTSSEMRKSKTLLNPKRLSFANSIAEKKERMARRKRGEEVFCKLHSSVAPPFADVLTYFIADEDE